MMRASLIAVAVIIGGCDAAKPVAPNGLVRPPEWAMNACDDLPQIPAMDGDPAKRVEYHKVERPAYVTCAEKQKVLARFVDTVAPKKK